MPPHFPVDEDTAYETKQWASDTIDNLFSDSQPITFEPVQSIPFPQQLEVKPIQKAVNDLKKKYTNNPARRSLSVLETSLFKRNCNNEDARPVARSSRSDIITSPCTLTHSDSAPSLLITSHTQHQKSLSARLKRTLTPEKPYLNKKALSNSEKEGIEIWKNTFNEYLVDSKMTPHGQSPHLLHFVLNELVTTETTYLEHLLIIKQMFMDPLLEAATTYPRPLVNLKDIQTIFAFIPELITLSTLLVNGLNKAINTTENGEIYGSIGKVFCDLEEELEIYIRYAANFSKQQRCIGRADRSIVYRQLVQ
ncbi:hypothetical protein CU098_007223, partial [Rhizopus stolonifer]